MKLIELQTKLIQKKSKKDMIAELQKFKSKLEDKL